MTVLSHFSYGIVLSFVLLTVTQRFQIFLVIKVTSFPLEHSKWQLKLNLISVSRHRHISFNTLTLTQKKNTYINNSALTQLFSNLTDINIVVGGGKGIFFYMDSALTLR